MFHLWSIYQTWLKIANDSYDEIIIFNMNIIIFISHHVKKRLWNGKEERKKS